MSSSLPDWHEGECPECDQKKKVREFPGFGILCSDCFFAKGRVPDVSTPRAASRLSSAIPPSARTRGAGPQQEAAHSASRLRNPSPSDRYAKRLRWDRAISVGLVLFVAGFVPFTLPIVLASQIGAMAVRRGFFGTVGRAILSMLAVLGTLLVSGCVVTALIYLLWSILHFPIELVWVVVASLTSAAYVIGRLRRRAWVRASGLGRVRTFNHIGCAALGLYIAACAAARGGLFSSLDVPEVAVLVVFVVSAFVAVMLYLLLSELKFTSPAVSLLFIVPVAGLIPLIIAGRRYTREVFPPKCFAEYDSEKHHCEDCRHQAACRHFFATGPAATAG